jgi:hypothetical protein
MTYKHHGLISMVLFSAMVIIGIVAIAVDKNWLAVVGYIILNLLSTVGVAYFYCAKCVCRENNNCSHYIIGKTADYLPKRVPAPYTITDYLGMMISAGIVFVFPIYWLLPHINMLIAFIAIGVIAGMEIIFAVCTHCENHRCLACKWQNKLKRVKSKE